MTATTPEQFLNHFFTECEYNVNVRALSPDHPAVSEYVRGADEILKFAEKYKDRNVYFGCATRNGGGGKEHIREIPGLWVDVDYKLTPQEEAKRLIGGFPFPPSYAIASGGGWHLYWALKESAGPEDIPRVEAILRGLAKVLKGDPSATDASRIMRIPGSLNHKKEYGKPRQVRVVRSYPDRKYNLSDFYLYAEDTSSTPKPADPIPERIHEGQRNSILTSLAGSMQRRGMTPAAIEAALLAENQAKCDPPLPEAEVRGIVANVKKYEPAAPVTPAPETPKAQVIVLENLNPRTVGEIIRDNTPDLVPLVDGIVYPETITVIGALVKMRKTWITLQLGFASVSGTDFLGHTIRRKLKVLYVGGEGSDRTIRKRLQTAIGYIPNLQDEDLENFAIVSTLGRVKLDTPAGEEWIQRVSEPYDLIFVDPYYRFLSVGSENLHEDQRTIQDVFDRLKAKGKAIVIVHHLRKPQGVDSGAAELRGAGLDAFADTILLLSRKKSGGDKRFNLKYILRHDEEPDDLELSLNGPLFKVADPEPPTVTTGDLVDILSDASEPLSTTQLKERVKALLTDATKRDIDDAISKAVKSMSIKSRPKPGKGRGFLYLVE
jgi:hypothetical protein